MALLHWLNGWRLMLVAFVVGNVAVSVWAIGGMNRCQDVVTRWTGLHPPSGNAEPFLIALVLNQSQGGMCICRKSGTGLGVSQEGFGP